MKELDFDELDRAVNTLMGGVTPSAPTPRVDEETRVIDIPTTIPDTSAASTPVMPRFTSPSRTTAFAPVAAAEPPTTPDSDPATAVVDTPVAPLVTPETTPEVAATTTTASRLSIPSRRAGRFMDVVHPSSDMKNPSNDTPSRAPSRMAPSLTPIANEVTDSSADQIAAMEVEETPEEAMLYGAFSEPDTIGDAVAAPEVNEVIDTPVTPTAPEEHLEPVAQVAHDWPDPLAGFTAEPDAAPVVDHSAALITENPSTLQAVSPSEDEAGDDELFTIDTTDLDEDPEPLVSPFLTDAKVNKRPLGDRTGDEPSRAPVLGGLADEVITTSDPDAQLPAEPATTVQPLPAELQGDLMAVESDNSGDVQDATVATDTDVATTPVAAPEASPNAPAQPASTDQATPSVGPTSIQQQYKEVPATGDQTNGTIYDTKAYHQPLAHPVKKKSGWMWVLWVFLLLAVGAGGAVALYYSGVI